MMAKNGLAKNGLAKVGHDREIFEVFWGLLVSDNVQDAEGEKLEMAISDISRAHFMAPMVELPEEDKLP